MLMCSVFEYTLRVPKTYLLALSLKFYTWHAESAFRAISLYNLFNNTQGTSTTLNKYVQYNNNNIESNSSSSNNTV